MSVNGTPKKPPEAALIAALAAGCTRANAGERAGLSERTVARRLKDPGFRTEVNRARSEILERSLGLLADRTTVAVATLSELLDDESPYVKLQASKAILDHALKFREQADLARRVEELEGLLGGSTNA